MAEERPEIAIKDFTDHDWEGLIVGANKPLCFDYSGLFFQQAKALRESGDASGEAAFRILGTITSYAMRPDSRQEPFVPPIQGIALPSDFGDNELDIIEELSTLASNPELSARLADVMWVSRRRYPLALRAVESYIKSAQTLEQVGEDFEASLRLKRALHLASGLRGGAQNLFSTAIDTIEDLIRKYQDDDSRMPFASGLMDLLLDFGTGDPSRYSQIAASNAVKQEQVGDWHFAQQFWRQKARWDRRSEDSEAEHNSLVRAAEMSVKIGELSAQGATPNFLVAAHYFQQAIEALRQIGEAEHADQLHRLMREYQRQSVHQMAAFETELDVEEFASQARNAVSGKSLLEAILTLILIRTPPAVETLEKRSDQYEEDHPLLALIGTQPIDSTGRVIASRPSRLSSDPNEQAEAKRADMFAIANRDQIVDVLAVIDPARKQIIREHRIDSQALAPFVAHNPCVPRGREEFFARGLAAGFHGDFIEACHLLIPQIENTVRELLVGQGALESSLRSDGLQEALNLNSLLYRSEVSEIFGADMVFALQGQFIEKFGANLRNRLAHGLMDQSEFAYPAVGPQYAWWLILRVCFLPVLNIYDQVNTSSDLGDNPGAS